MEESNEIFPDLHDLVTLDDIPSPTSFRVRVLQTMEVEDSIEAEQPTMYVYTSATLSSRRDEDTRSESSFSVSSQTSIESVSSADDSNEQPTRRLDSIVEENRSQSPVLYTSSNQNSPVKRNITDESEQPPRKVLHADEDGKTCSICLDNWTNIGEHRICSLKCGHLFGLSCVLTWFGQKQYNCPTCKQRAKKHDIRNIYANELIAMDATELEDIKRQLQESIEQKNRVEIELTKAVSREHMLIQQVEDLRKRITFLHSRGIPFPRQDVVTEARKIQLFMDKSMSMCKEGGCRVLDFCKLNNLVAVSSKSPNPIFKGYGVRKIDFTTYKVISFIPLHTTPIRDIQFHPQNPLLLSVSLDKTLKIVDGQTSHPVCCFEQDSPLWSCCWSLNDSNCFYVGKQSGSVLKFDIRQMGQHVDTFTIPGDMSPVVSVASMTPNQALPGGVISCKLNSLWAFVDTLAERTRYPLPMEGPFTSMTYNNTDNKLLVSTRPNSRINYSRHHLCTLENGPNSVICNTVHCFAGSTSQKFLSRSCITSYNFENYVAAHQEGTKTVCLWSVKTGQKVSSVPAHEPVLDLKGVDRGYTASLLTLSEQKLDVFKYV